MSGLNINKVTKIGVEREIERGIEIGRDQEKHAWGVASHSSICITVACPPQSVATQTDTHTVSSTSISMAIQTMPITPTTASFGTQTNTPYDPTSSKQVTATDLKAQIIKIDNLVTSQPLNSPKSIQSAPKHSICQHQPHTLLVSIPSPLNPIPHLF